MKQRRRCLGLTVSEYALILALVVIVAIGGLALLGGNTSTILGNILGKGGGTAKPGTGNKQNGSPIDISAVSSIRIVKGPNGQVSYQVTMNTGSGTQVTSAEGTDALKVLTNEMQKLVNQNAASGSSDPAIQKALQQFQDDLANYQSQIAQYMTSKSQYDSEAQQLGQLEAQGNHQGPPYFSQAATAQVFSQTEAFLKLGSDFTQLNGLLSQQASTNSNIADLQKQVSQIAGMASEVAINDPQSGMNAISTNIYADRINPSVLPTMLSNNPQTAKLFIGISLQTGGNNSAFQSGIRTAAQQNWMGSANPGTLSAG